MNHYYLFLFFSLVSLECFRKFDAWFSWWNVNVNDSVYFSKYLKKKYEKSFIIQRSILRAMKDFIQDDLCKRNYKIYTNTSNNLICTRNPVDYVV